MSHKKCCVVLYGPIYLLGWTLWFGIGIGLKHVYNQDSWYWSWIVSNIKTSLGIGLEKISISRLVLVLVLTENWNQDKSWYWSWKKIEINTGLGLGLEQNKWSRRTLFLNTHDILIDISWTCLLLQLLLIFKLTDMRTYWVGPGLRLEIEMNP